MNDNESKTVIWSETGFTHLKKKQLRSETKQNTFKQ